MRIADLPWYDLPELVDATDSWGCGIAGDLRRLGVEAVPEALCREGSHVDRWRHPELLLSQACGCDVLYDAADDVAPLATPCYTAEGCEGPRYRSIGVVRSDHRAQAFEEEALEAGYFELPAPARSPLSRLRWPGRERRACSG